MKKIKGLAALLLAGSIVLTGCNTGGKPAAADTKQETTVKAEESEAAAGTEAAPTDAKKEKVYVAISIRTLSNPYFATIKEGAEMFCKYLDSIGQENELQVLLCEGSNDKQVNDIKAFAAKANGNGILMVDPNEAAITPVIADICEETGVYMVTTWNKTDDVGPEDYEHWVAHHSPDNVKSGHDIAKTMFDTFETPGKGKILVIQGMLGNTSTVERFKGLQEALKEYPDVELVEDQAADWDTQQALKLVETWLSKYDDIDGIWCANDNMALGAVQALKAKGLNGKVKVAGVDGIDDAVFMIESGDMVATMGSNGWLQGGYSLAIAYGAWSGAFKVSDLSPEQRVFNTEGILITPDTVGDYKKNYIDKKPSYDFSKPFDCIYQP